MPTAEKCLLFVHNIGVYDQVYSAVHPMKYLESDVMCSYNSTSKWPIVYNMHLLLYVMSRRSSGDVHTMFCYATRGASKILLDWGVQIACGMQKKQTRFLNNKVISVSS